MPLEEDEQAASVRRGPIHFPFSADAASLPRPRSARPVNVRGEIVGDDNGLATGKAWHAHLYRAHRHGPWRLRAELRAGRAHAHGTPQRLRQRRRNAAAVKVVGGAAGQLHDRLRRLGLVLIQELAEAHGAGALVVGVGQRPGVNRLALGRDQGWRKGG